MIYTPNEFESLQMQLRKTIKNRGDFLNDDAALKLIFLALRVSPTAREYLLESGAYR